MKVVLLKAIFDTLYQLINIALILAKCKIF